MKMRRRSTGRVTRLAIALAMVGLAAPALAADDDLPVSLDPIPSDQVGANFDITDGEYAGSVGLHGDFWFENEGVSIVWSGGGTGPLEFSVVNGQLEGTWSLDGQAIIYGIGIDMAGTNTWSTSGPVSGSNPYTMSGSGSGSTSVTISGFESGDDYAITIAPVPWQGVVQVCGQVLGNWDQAVADAYNGLPPEFDYNIPTYFAAFPVNSLTDLEQRVDDLLAQGLEIEAHLGDPIEFVLGELGDLLLKAEDLMGDIEAYPDDCPPDPSFVRVITQVVGDVMNTFLGQWSGETPDSIQITALRRLVEVGLRAGAIGSGAADPAAAAHLEAAAKMLVQRQLDWLNEQEGFDTADYTEVAMTASMLGYTFDGGMTGPDICLVLGSC